MMMEVMILLIMLVVMIALGVAIMSLVVHIDVEIFHHGPLIDWFGYWSSPDENSITLTLYF